MDKPCLSVLNLGNVVYKSHIISFMSVFAPNHPCRGQG